MVPLGVDVQPLETVETGNKQSITNGWRPYVLALGRLHPVKGLELLIRSFLNVVRQDRFENWRLVIAGDGEPSYAGSLRRLAETRGGNGNVIFPGWLDGAAKDAALRQAAVVAVPSHQESFGMTVFEALGRGVPVAVSGNIDVADLVERERAGWTFDLDESSISSVLARAFAEEAERAERGQRGRFLVETRFTWPIVAGQLQELYRDVCGHD
jgi:glycosyltransferase involved in cell wall biosynthesis